MEVDGKYYPPENIYFLSEMKIDFPTKTPAKTKPPKDDIEIISEMIRSGQRITIEQQKIVLREYVCNEMILKGTDRVLFQDLPFGMQRFFWNAHHDKYEYNEKLVFALFFLEHDSVTNIERWIRSALEPGREFKGDEVYQERTVHKNVLPMALMSNDTYLMLYEMATTGRYKIKKKYGLDLPSRVLANFADVLDLKRQEGLMRLIYAVRNIFQGVWKDGKACTIGMTGYGAEVDACHEIEHYGGPNVEVFDYCDRHFRILELDLLKFAWKLTRFDKRPFLLDRLDYAIEKVEGAYFWLPIRCEICNDPDYILNDLDAHGLFPWCVCEETPQKMLSKYISEEFKPLIQSIFAPFEEAQLKKINSK